VDSRHHPFRKCIGCRAARPKEELLRFVKATSAHAEFDMDGRNGGRGFYLCPDEKCFGKAHGNKKTRAAYFRKQDTIEETIGDIRETILKSIEKDLILCKKMGYLIEARNEEKPLEGDDLVLVARDNPLEEKVKMHTAAHSSKARLFLLPAAADSPVGSCAVSKSFPMVKRLTMNLQKYELLSSKGQAL
jgi:predicted RNA-binding protein YlxR (DUF448 family)